MMKIYLRPIQESDGRLIVKWRNTPNVAKHCFNREPITEESNREFYRSEVLTGHYKQYIVERQEETFGVASYSIATVYLKNIDNTNHRCQLCVFTSDDEEWNSESQVIAVRMLLKIAFNELEMEEVYSYVFVKYADEVDLLKKVGFSIESKEERMENSQCNQVEDVYRMVIHDV